MRRGFKAEAERTADKVRTDMRLRPADALDAVALASHVGAEIHRADELAPLEKLKRLEKLQRGAFSACTFTLGERSIIVYNPLASPGRQQSDIAHEVAHLLLRHELKEIHQLAGQPFFTCDPEEEQEANWLAGCLLLPRALLITAARRGMDSTAIANQYGVSEQMAGFRLRTTGVVRQLRAG